MKNFKTYFRPSHEAFRAFVLERRDTFAPVIKTVGERLVRLDLRPETFAEPNAYQNLQRFQTIIHHRIAAQNGTIGIGGYGERRPFYTADFYENSNGKPQHTERRSIHLGLDLWHAADTPVFAPCEGKVHSFANNPANGDYGATIILEHRTCDGLPFYTLYGHLSLASLRGLSVGQGVETGQQIATFGTPAENGNWPPHLHFQVMLDMLGKRGDFQGVALPSEAEDWLTLCPDPELFFDKK